MPTPPLNASRKSVIISVPDDRHNVMEPIFSKSEFDKAVESKGYTVTVEQAVRCPCQVTSVGQGNPACLNCGGTGWFFISKKQTTALVQSMNRRTKYLNWSETDRGTSQISLKGEDRVCFMDRITVLEVEAIFSQTSIVRVSSIDSTKIFAFLIYAPTSIEYIYLYIAPDQPHKLLAQGTDYTIEADHILFTNTVRSFLQNNSPLDGSVPVGRVGVRYKHNPTYHILDIPRETTKAFSEDDEETDLFQVPIQNPTIDIPQKELMPVNAVGRKVHFMFDSPNLSGDSLFDNTPPQS